MRITIVAIGRARSGPKQDLVEHYRTRFDQLCSTIGLAKLNIIEVEEKRPIKGAERQAREAVLLEQAMPKDASIFALDERGKALTSQQLTQALQQMRDSGLRDLCFVIGGADGLTKEIKSQAERTLSFGPATWPHMLVRAMLAEQLYRAATILAGHPYHKV